ncbi:MAG: CofH family radical SAM protein [Deltaproteobacteria bacterium]|nr:CofH family radical SAM protein [Deltaproteobacteria bacterium]
MNFSDFPDSVTNKRLRTIAQKVYEGIPASKSDANYMLTTNDILDLGKISDFVRTRLHGDIAYYGVNMNLNFTNICELRCPLCAFSRDEGDKDAFVLSLDQIEARVQAAVKSGIDEVHIVGGLNPELSIDYFEQMIRRIKKIKPEIFVVAFTAVEIDYFAKKAKISARETLKRLMKAGVGAMPGGGAEIFSPHIRHIIAPAKISGKRWLQIMRSAHELGLKTNVTMLYNHKEGVEDITDHLARIRKLQDETHGFKTFVPLLFHGENTNIEAKRRTSTGYDDIRIYATSRIFLHNVLHLKALWMYLSDKMAQILLKFGVDDFAATYQNEKVVHAAGAKTPDYGSESFLKRLIENAGLKPVRTTANYWIQ